MLSVYLILTTISLYQIHCFAYFQQVGTLSFPSVHIPPFVIHSSGSNLILAGLGDIASIDLNNGGSHKLPFPLLDSCILSKLSKPIFPLEYISGSQFKYLYCQSTHSLYILSKDPHPVVLKAFTIPDTSSFTDVKFFEDEYNDVLYVLGLIGDKELANEFRRYNASYLITLDLATYTIDSVRKVVGKEGEPIIDFQITRGQILITLGIKYQDFGTAFNLYKEDTLVHSLVTYEAGFLPEIKFLNNEKQIIITKADGFHILNTQDFKQVHIIKNHHLEYEDSKFRARWKHMPFSIMEDKYLVFYDPESQKIQKLLITETKVKLIVQLPMIIPNKVPHRKNSLFLPFKDSGKILVLPYQSNYFNLLDMNAPDARDLLLGVIPSAESVESFHFLGNGDEVPSLIQHDAVITYSMTFAFESIASLSGGVEASLDAESPNLIWKISYSLDNRENCYIDGDTMMGTNMVHYMVPSELCSEHYNYHFIIASDSNNPWSFNYLAYELKYPGRAIYYNGWEYKKFELSTSEVLNDILFTGVRDRVCDLKILTNFRQQEIAFYWVYRESPEKQSSYYLRCSLKGQLKCDEQAYFLQSAARIELYKLNEEFVAMTLHESQSSATTIYVYNFDSALYVDTKILEKNFVIVGAIGHPEASPLNLQWIGRCHENLYKILSLNDISNVAEQTFACINEDKPVEIGMSSPSSLFLKCQNPYGSSYHVYINQELSR